MNSNLDYLRQYAPITVNIQGEVSFSHISKMYEGEELIAANKRAQEHGGRPSSRPYCTLTLDNPRILSPETLPPDVVMIMQQRFKPAKTTNVVKYYATSKSPNLPPVAYSVYAGAGLAGQGIADKAHPLAHELDTGLTVTVGVKIFDTAAGVGAGIDYVLIDEPIRYYESNAIADALASQGVTYVAPDADKNQNAAAARPVSDKAVVDNSTYPSDGFANIPKDFAETLPAGGEMPFDPSLYYEENYTMPVAAAMQNTAPQRNMNNNGMRQNAQSAAGQNVYCASMQPQGNRNGAAQNVYGTSMQPQANGNEAGQNIYGTSMQPQGNENRGGAAQNVRSAVMQPQRNRKENAQTSQAPANPMVRTRMPGQPQSMTA